MRVRDQHEKMFHALNTNLMHVAVLQPRAGAPTRPPGSLSSAPAAEALWGWCRARGASTRG